MQSVTNYLKSNMGAIGIGVGSAALGATVGYVAGSRSSSKKARKRSKSASRKRKTKRRVRKTPYTAGKRKDRSRKRIRYTKTGQPYVILASGKARFITKRGAKMSRKRKGGRY